LHQAIEDHNMPIDPEPLLSEQGDIIFVVEADEVIRSALHFILDDQNETHSFASLVPAFAKSAEVSPYLVILGIDLFRENAETALAEIARRMPGTRILIVANSANDPLAVSCLKWGAHDVLGRPITFDSVRGKVDTLLGRRDFSPALLGLLPLSAAW
jgi:DNA-binding NtrC family response regulator